MTQFAIIEVDNGATIVELSPGVDPVEIAERHGGVLLDPGPYTYEEAADALLEFETEVQERD